MQFNFEKLEVWQLGMKVVNKIYRIVKNFPASERFELTSQIKRASLSIPLNIAEGSGRKTKKDFCKFLRNSIGSILEVITCLKIALQEKFITENEYEENLVLLEKIYFKLIALEKSLS
jgi:four helix bundle protein